MEFLRTGWKSVVGSQEEEAQPKVAETIEKLLERIQTSTLLDDRRDACRAIKSLSKTYRLQVGAVGLDILISVLESDRHDIEILSYVLDSLNSIICGTESNDYEGYPVSNEDDEDIGKQFTEMFVKRKDNVSHLLSVIEEVDFKVRWPSMKLFMGLLKNKLRDVQEIILSNPRGISRLIDLLSDTREIIRNDAIILFLHLTRGHANIQKIVAFENAFDKLFEIIALEGYSDGGVVVEDCLMVLLNLLKNNFSNINFFSEGSYIQRLVPFIDLQNTDTSKEWSTQRSANILLLLQVIRSLVSPRNPTQVNLSCQKNMQKCLILEKLCNILLASDLPPDILIETINTIAEVIRGNQKNQEYFISVNLPNLSPSTTLMYILLTSMVNEKQPFELRSAVLYCFQCFLYKNEFGQAQIIETLMQQTNDNTTSPCGQLLLGALFSEDSLNIWLSAVALSHILVENKLQKEQLLKVKISYEENSSTSFTLFHKCCIILQHSINLQARVGVLMLLCTWLSNCPLAVGEFLTIPTNVPYLISQVGLVESDDQEIVAQGMSAFLLGICVQFNSGNVQSITKSDLCDLIINRIGVDNFVDKLNSVSKHEKYSAAAQKPQLKQIRKDEISFDYEFCRLFKSLEGSIIKLIQNLSDNSNDTETMTEEQNKLLLQYKALIMDQDNQVNELKNSLAKVKLDFDKTSKELSELSETCQQLRDQNALLKIQKTSPSSSLTNLNEDFINNQLIELKKENESLIKQLLEAKAELARAPKSTSISEPIPEVKINIGDLDDEYNRSFNNYNSEKGDSIELLNNVQSGEIEKLNKEINTLKDDLRKERAITSKLKTELEIAVKDQDEILDLLYEEQAKVNLYKNRLKALGEKFEEEEDEVDEEDEVKTEDKSV